MRADATDARELPSTAHQHYLDDPYYDFVEDGSDGGGGFWGALAVAVLLVGMLLTAHWYLVPPPVVFKPPMIPLPAAGKCAINVQVMQSVEVFRQNDGAKFVVQCDGTGACRKVYK